MRTTITFADDVSAAIEGRRRERGIGVSEAVNELIREGLVEGGEGEPPFVQRTHELGLAVDVTNVAEALEELEGPAHR